MRPSPPPGYRGREDERVGGTMVGAATADPSPNRARGGVRQLHRELTRARLADAAVELFCSAGYVATTIDDITAAAGTTRATFYLHFKSKAEIVLEVLQRLDEEYAPVFAALATVAERPDAAGIRSWLESTLATWERTQHASAAVSQAALLEPTLQERRLSAFERDIEQLSAALQRSGRWDATGARVRAVLMLSQLEQLFLRWSIHGWDAGESEVIPLLCAMWCAALGIPHGEA